MIGRNKRGIRRAGSMRVRLAVAAAVLVGGGAAGAVAVATNHSSTATATSSGYSTNFGSPLSESQAMSSAMNWWSRSQTTSLITITEMVTIRTVAVVPFHNHMFVVQRGVVLGVAPGVFALRSTNGQLEIWHFNGGTQFLNVGNSRTGWNALSSNGTMSSWGSFNWSNSSRSMWNTRTRTLAAGDVAFVFGLKVNGQLHAQLVLFAAPNKFTAPTWFPSSSSSSSSTGFTGSSSSSSSSSSTSGDTTTINGQQAVTGTHS